MIWIVIAFIVGTIIGTVVMACFTASGRASEREQYNPPQNWRGEEAISNTCVACEHEHKSYFEPPCMDCGEAKDGYSNFEPKHKLFGHFDEGQE